MQDGLTATNPQTGEKVVLRGGQWVPMGGSAAPAPPPAPRAPDRIYGGPKPVDPIEARRLELSEQANARATNADIRAADAANRAADASVRTARTDEMKMTGGLRDDYQRDPAVGTYLKALPSYAAALESSPTPQGDLNLIYAFAKVMDPDSVVREGEAASVSNSDTIYGRTVARLQKELSGSGTFSAEARENLRRELAVRMRQLNDAYIGARVRYKGLAEKGGFDPAAIVGEHAGKRFQDTESKFLGRPVAEADYDGNPVAPAATGNNFAKGSVTGNAAEVGVEVLAGMRPSSFEFLDQSGAMRLTYPDGRSQDVSASDVSDDFQYSAQFRDAYRAKFGEDPPMFFRVSEDGGGGDAGNGATPAPDRDTTFGKIDAFVRGAADVPTFGLADEIAAAARTVFGDGTMRENLASERAIDRTDEQVNPEARFGGQITGAVLTAGMVPSWMRPTTGKGYARAGAASGGAYGYGSGEGGPLSGSRFQNALLGAGAGAVTGYGFGKAGEKVGNALATRGAARGAARIERNALLQAAERQGIEPMAADVGGPLVRRMTAGAAQAPLSASSVVNASQRVVDQSRAARDRVASKVGEVLDPETAGEIAREGGAKFIKYTRDVGGSLYDRAEKLAGNASVAPQRAVAVLDAAIDRMSQNPSAQGGQQLGALQKLRDQLANGRVSIVGMRDMRTKLRDQYIDEGFRSNSFQQIIRDVVDATGEDIADGLTEQGLERAVGAFKTADRYWRGRVEMIDNFLEPIIGRGRSGEQVMRALEDAAKNKGRQLQGFVRALPDKERESVQATIISRLGTKRGDAEAADFSLDVFLTQWKSLTPRAKAALFPGEARAALNDLAKVAEGSKAAMSYANRSNTGGAIGSQVLMSGGLGMISPTAFVVGYGGQAITGKLLASPAFAKWLARAPKSASERGMQAWVGRLPSALGNAPAIRGEVQAFQQRLLEGLSSMPGRAGASGPDASNGVAERRE